MAEPMNIWQLEEYAKDHEGYKTGHFLSISEKGIAEFKWLDAYCGIAQIVGNDGEVDNHFITTKQLRKIFGDDAKYLPTIGYKEDD